MFDDTKYVVETCDHLCYLCFVSVILSCLFFAALWPPAVKGANLFAIVCDVFLYFFTFDFIDS